LKLIYLDRDRTEDERIKVVLLMIVTCVITPNRNWHNCKISYVKFIKNLDEVDFNVWAAAMLSYLYQGMKLKMEEGKLFDGFLWLIIVRSIIFSFIFFLSSFVFDNLLTNYFFRKDSSIIISKVFLRSSKKNWSKWRCLGRQCFYLW
jgi:hypothetical protein